MVWRQIIDLISRGIGGAGRIHQCGGRAITLWTGCWAARYPPGLLILMYVYTADLFKISLLACLQYHCKNSWQPSRQIHKFLDLFYPFFYAGAQNPSWEQEEKNKKFNRVEWGPGAILFCQALRLVGDKLYPETFLLSVRKFKLGEFKFHILLILMLIPLEGRTVLRVVA